MHLRRLLIGATLLLTLLTVAGFVYLRSLGLFSGAPIYSDDAGAIGGYDPVAYFTQGRAVAGDPTLTHTWNGATWSFSSPEHRQRFIAEPHRYAPRFGGYCAYAVSEGYTARSDPRVWTIADERLYLNFDQAVSERWAAERDARIKAAERNWPALLGPG